MIVTKAEPVRTDENNKDWYRVVIVSSEEPASLDLDGSDVEGMADGQGIAAGSVLIAPSSNYIAFEDGVFTLKSSGGGGGADENTPGIMSIEVYYNSSDVTASCSFDPELPAYDTLGEGVSITLIMPDAPDDTYDLFIQPTAVCQFAYAEEAADPTFLGLGEPWATSITLDNGYGDLSEYSIYLCDASEQPITQFTLNATTQGPK